MNLDQDFACWLTPAASGAVGVLHMRAQPQRLSTTLSITLPEIGRASLRRICNLDEALVLRVTENTIIVTPHGGPRLRQRLVRAISDAGISFISPTELSPADLFVESTTDIQARMLYTLARAASADAIALLLAQPERWKKNGAPTPADAPRSKRLCRLIDPPTVVIAGAPNAGKSTLLNALLGRTAAVTSPIAGTTRDFVSANIVLAGLACRVVDAPGFMGKKLFEINLPEKNSLKKNSLEKKSLHTDLNQTNSNPSAMQSANQAPSSLQAQSAIDQAAIARARQEIHSADLVIALAAPDQAWPAIEHSNILRVRSMCDLSTAVPMLTGNSLFISGRTGAGLIEFAQAVRAKLVPATDIASDRPWQFC
jgi:tRNA U34 5-carboxymethylaminomethyl modifying GTPase MnmE/TrmE